MSNFTNIGNNGLNVGAFGGNVFGNGEFLTGISPSKGIYAQAGINSVVPIAVNNSYLFANAGGNFQKKENSQAGFNRQFGIATNLGGLLGVKYTDSDRAKDIELSSLSPLGLFTINKTKGLQDMIKGTFESGISPSVGAKLIASVEKEKGQAIRYMTEISLAPFEHATLSTRLYGQGKKTDIGINFGYSRNF